MESRTQDFKVTVRFSARLLKRLDEIASALATSRSQVVRMLVEGYQR